MSQAESITGDKSFSAPGALLRQARTDAKLSQIEVAKKLNVRVQQVAALEEDRYEFFPAPVYAKGLIRNYAKLLGLSIDELSNAFDEQARRHKVCEKPLNSKQPPKVNPASGHHIHLALAAMLVVVVVMWYSAQNNVDVVNQIDDLWADQFESSNDNGDRKQMAGETSVKLDLGSLITVNTIPDNQFLESKAAADPSTTALLADEPAAPAEAQSVISSSSESTIISAPIKGLLRFSFSADCWVQVSDRNDNIIASVTKRADETLTVSGEAPFSIILGYAPGVEIEFNGEAVDIDAISNSNSARLVVGRS